MKLQKNRKEGIYSFFPAHRIPQKSFFNDPYGHSVKTDVSRIAGNVESGWSILGRQWRLGGQNVFLLSCIKNQWKISQKCKTPCLRWRPPASYLPHDRPASMVWSCVCFRALAWWWCWSLLLPLLLFLLWWAEGKWAWFMVCFLFTWWSWFLCSTSTTSW